MEEACIVVAFDTCKAVDIENLGRHMEREAFHKSCAEEPYAEEDIHHIGVVASED
jgi:hypothetical protein